MNEIVELKITNYRFAIGGEHYYGKLHVKTKAERVVSDDGSVSYVHRGGFGVERHPHDQTDLKRPMTTKEATYLNKKDGNELGWGYKRGDLTTRFDDEASIIRVAIEQFPTLFDETDILVTVDDRYIYTVLVGPEPIREFLNGNPSHRAQNEFLEEQGYLTK